VGQLSAKAPDVRRRLVYLAAGILLGWVAFFAVVWSEARLDFIALTALIAVGAWWVVRRLPARPVSSWELGGAAVLAFVTGVSLAVLIPTTHVMCDCPAPRGVTGGYMCNCPIDRHMAVRTALVVGGFVLSLAARRRAFLTGTRTRSTGGKPTSTTTPAPRSRQRRALADSRSGVPDPSRQSRIWEPGAMFLRRGRNRVERVRRLEDPSLALR
jgi:hypothetical protein